MKKTNNSRKEKNVRDIYNDENDEQLANNLVPALAAYQLEDYIKGISKDQRLALACLEILLETIKQYQTKEG